MNEWVLLGGVAVLTLVLAVGGSAVLKRLRGPQSPTPKV